MRRTGNYDLKSSEVCELLMKYKHDGVNKVSSRVDAHEHEFITGNINRSENRSLHGGKHLGMKCLLVTGLNEHKVVSTPPPPLPIYPVEVRGPLK